MDATKVAEILSSMGLPAVANGYGFPIGYEPGSSLDTWGDVVVRGEYRVERGSGIAGRGDTWRIVAVKSGRSGKACSTEKALRTALREWLAGPKPNFPGIWYAKRNRHRYSDDYIWVRRSA